MLYMKINNSLILNNYVEQILKTEIWNRENYFVLY